MAICESATSTPFNVMYGSAPLSERSNKENSFFEEIQSIRNIGKTVKQNCKGNLCSRLVIYMTKQT